MLNIKNAAKEKLEIVKVQDFGSEFLAKPPPPQAAKCVRTTLRIDHQISLLFIITINIIILSYG